MDNFKWAQPKNYSPDEGYELVFPKNPTDVLLDYFVLFALLFFLK